MGSFLIMHWAQSLRSSQIISHSYPCLVTNSLTTYPVVLTENGQISLQNHPGHVPGKLLYTADTLSRSPMANSTNDILKFEEVEKFIAVASSLNNDFLIIEFNLIDHSSLQFLTC